MRACFEAFFRGSPRAQFQFSDIFAAGTLACVRWLYRWVEPDGQPGYIRGVDVFRTRGHRIVEKLSYVKG